MLIKIIDDIIHIEVEDSYEKVIAWVSNMVPYDLIDENAEDV